ncbi:MAG: hypothetical protein RL757_3172 [Bacteroidota bacterium]|jgi:DNA mismatch repair protein MutL
MADVIQLLPDSIANQIAAGEVIQRPASGVKELLENAIDAGARNIQLILKDAGKTLIQVIDDGCGMSETDARMCFERHATSKIRSAEDLFSIRTMGFRGEAMASIASVAQVELRTRQRKSELGTRVVVEGFEFKGQEPCQTPVGTNFIIKNLFYNVPARRNFLKSNPVEMRHIMDEFERVAMAYPDIHFSLVNNGQELYHFPIGNLRQRIVGILGNAVNSRLVPIGEETDVVRFEGFIGKPAFAKKSRGEQFFFVNGRFIKSPYLEHAVRSAFEDLLPKETYPLFVIFIDIDPAKIDVNVHPTKQEIKFEEEKLIYSYLKVAIRHALGQSTITPTLDFDQDLALMRSSSSSHIQPNYEQQEPVFFGEPDKPVRLEDMLGFGNEQEMANLDDILNKGDASGEKNIKKSTPPSINDQNSRPSKTEGDFSFLKRANKREEDNLKNWQTLYDGLNFIVEDDNGDATESDAPMTTLSSRANDTEPNPNQTTFDNENADFGGSKREPYQIHGIYIVSHIKSGFLLIDQQAAHERILFEQYLTQLDDKTVLTQAELFPRTLQFSAQDAMVIREILPQVNALGFDLREFGGNAFVMQGVPADLPRGTNEQRLIETLLEQFKMETDLKLGINEKIARAMARSAAMKRGNALSIAEMQALIDQLFACAMPFKSPTGRACFITYALDDLQKDFLNQ